MHTTTLRQFRAMPERPQRGRGQLQVPKRSHSFDVKPQAHKHAVSTTSQIKRNVEQVEQVRRKVRPTPKNSGNRRIHAAHLAKTARQADVLSRAIHAHAPKVVRRQSKFASMLGSLFSRRSVASFVVAVILVSTGYVTIDTWLTNRQVAQATSSGDEGTNGSTNTEKNHDPRSEGRDETPLPANALATYSVASEKPRALYVDKLGVAARILPVGVNTDSSMQAPTNIYDTGWYTGSSAPGELGAVAIDAHSSGATKFGAFGKLDELEKGDTVTIEKGDGKKITYKVVAKEIVHRDKVNMKKFLLPYGDALRGANFITCTGDWESDNSTMKERVIVYTRQVS